MLEEHGHGRRLEIAGTVCGTIKGQRDVLMSNRALGLGLERPPTDADLDEIEAFFREAETHYYVSVSPRASGLVDLLAKRGYEPGYAWAVFRRGVEPYEADTELHVEEIGPDQAQGSRPSSSAPTRCRRVRWSRSPRSWDGRGGTAG